MIKKGKHKILYAHHIALKKFIKVIVNAAVFGYITFSLISLSACSKRNDDLSFDEQVAQKRNTVKLLLEKYNADLFVCGSEVVLEKPVVLDSIILGIKKEGQDYYIKARIKSACTKKYFAELKCDKEIIEQVNHAKSSAAYLAVKIYKVDGCNMVAETDTLDGSKSELYLGNAYLLSGECLAFSEIPSFLNSN